MDMYDDDVLGPAARDHSPSHVTEAGPMADQGTVCIDKHQSASPFIMAVYSNPSRPTSIGVLDAFNCIV